MNYKDKEKSIGACYYCGNPVYREQVSSDCYMIAHISCVDKKRQERIEEKLKYFDTFIKNIKCGCCGCSPLVYERIPGSRVYPDPEDKRRGRKDVMLNFHWHHLFYEREGIVYTGEDNKQYTECGIWLCNKCHASQNGRKTPINRFLRLQETTKREDIKAWCKNWLNYLRAERRLAEDNFIDGMYCFD